MARRLIRRALAVAIAVIALVGLASCTNTSAPKAAAGLTTRNVTAGDVKISITPLRVDGTGASFRVGFETHSGALDLNVARNATLTVDGAPWGNAAWSGDGPGGHHRSGTLTFVASGPARGAAHLDITGFGAPVTASWQLGP